MISIPIIDISIRSGTQLWGQAQEVVHNIVTYLKESKSYATLSTVLLQPKKQQVLLSRRN